jgi:hypothetical protein
VYGLTDYAELQLSSGQNHLHTSSTMPEKRKGTVNVLVLVLRLYSRSAINYKPQSTIVGALCTVTENLVLFISGCKEKLEHCVKLNVPTVRFSPYNTGKRTPKQTSCSTWEGQAIARLDKVLPNRAEHALCRPHAYW